MKNNRIVTLLSLFVFVIMLFSNITYATTTTITIDDQSSDTGFIKKDDQLYYVVSVNLKSTEGNLSVVKFELKYDSQYLEPISEATSLDLGEKGKFDGAVVQVYDKWLGSVKINKEKLLFSADNYDSNKSELKCIDDSDITVLKVCFKVLDNQEKRRPVYIDFNDGITEISYTEFNTKDKYATNGVSQKDVEKLEIDKTSPSAALVDYDFNFKYDRSELEEVKDTNNSSESSDLNNSSDSNNSGNSSSSTNKPSNSESGNVIKEETKVTEGQKNDATLADKILPKTGITALLKALAVVIIVAIVFFIKMRKYNKIFK